MRGIDPKAKEQLKKLIKGYKKLKSNLRPNEKDEWNPDMPVKYKINYFNRDQSQSGKSLSLSKA